MDPHGVQRRLAATLSADVVGYSRLMAEDEAATIRTLGAYQDQIRGLVGEHRGRVVDAPGDNVLAEFHAARDAVECAVEIQRVVQARNASLPEDRRMQFRIGVHLGDLAAEGGRIYGDGVNIAARLEGMAEPGGICISDSVHQQVRDKVPVEYVDLGEHEVKNLPHPVRVYRVEIPAAPVAPFPRIEARRWGRLAGAVLLVAGVAALVWWSSPPAPGPASLPTSIAVLPFADMSPDSDQEYFSDGMAEELINTLSKIEGLRVVARTSAFAFKGKDVGIREIAEQLDVGAVVEGSVRKAGDRLRITAQLVQVADGFHLWSETYDRGLEDVFAVQGEIARAVGEALQLQLGGSSLVRSTENPRAYELYLTGRFFWSQRTAEGMRRAIEYFERAVGEDPAYAKAFAGLADAHRELSSYGFDTSEQTREKAIEAATRAIQLDGGLAEARASLGGLRMQEWDWLGAEEEFRRSLELDPHYATAHHALGYLLATTGRLEQAIGEIERAIELDPLSPAIRNTAGIVYLGARQYHRAMEHLQRAVELNPTPQTRTNLAHAYLLNGMEKEAVEEFLRQGFPPEVETALRTESQANGVQGAIRKLLQLEVARTGEDCTNAPQGAAQMSAFIGERDRMFECLRRAQDQWVHIFLTGLPIWDDHRQDPRFTAILRKMGLEE